jgi:4-hydroxymandelate oxidase
MSDALNLRDFESLAAERLSRMAYDYFASGSGDEITLRENESAFSRLALRYRVLVDVSKRSLETTLLGRRIAMPILVAPMAFQRLAHDDGELATARAAAAAGSVMILSTLATYSIEEVRAASSGSLWFQLYVYRDRDITRSLVERAEAAGYEALVLTVDAPLLGRRERDVRNGFSLPEGLPISNLIPRGLERMAGETNASGLEQYFTDQLNPSLTWADVEWLQSITRLPVLVKGIVRADDAERAVDHGAAGIIVSNHGGRQLDTSIATISALPPIADAVGDRCDLLVDGGIRRGTDVLKALAFGARAVLIGRPVLWGLAVDGEAGVSRVLSLLRDELDLAMALAGCTSPAKVTADLVA